jgi:hypothetical protein
MVKMVFSRGSCPAFTITTNGETGILQIVQEILLVAAYQAIPGERPPWKQLICLEEELHSSPVSSHFKTSATHLFLPAMSLLNLAEPSMRIGNGKSACVNRSMTRP